MKKILLAATILISLSVKSQNYADSTITLTLTQRSAIYVGQYIKTNTSAAWTNRLTPSVLRPYIGSGSNLDSTFSVTLKADYIRGMIELLLGSQNEVVQADRRSIIDNAPSVPGYTALSTQIVNKANGNSSEKQTAIYIRDYYLQRLSDFAAVRAEYINAVVNWSRN